jgi:hypothetical protein
MVTYWTLWFTHRSWVASSSTPLYYGFENSFPLADALLTLSVLATIYSLTTRRSGALLFGLMGSGAGLYLFAMDVLFDLEHGIWSRGTNGAIELAINVVTLSASVALARWLWTRRGELDVTAND